MQEFNRGSVRANQLTFEYLTQGDGPLALCVHGFPDSPFSYRYLLPALADAGYRAAAPFNRGFAPTELPDDRHHVHSSTMVADHLRIVYMYPPSSGGTCTRSAQRPMPTPANARFIPFRRPLLSTGRRARAGFS